MIHSKPVVSALIILCMLMVSSVSFSTPYIPYETLLNTYQGQEQQEGPNRFPAFELDEFDYDFEYNQIISWLPQLQVTDPGINYGGMREGEQDLEIIQTDNTQEALRDWARYGLITGDIEVYHDNIDAAWQYIMNHPAYDEEGGGNPNYYRVHNCGWGLVATMEYTRTYGDSTYLWYGDSCATYLDTYRLPMSGGPGDVNSLSAGYGAGTLYLYGRWRDNQQWMNAAQEIAIDVRTWLEADINRVHSFETWAMSGGTAMWGVVTALYLDDPEAGAEWIPPFSAQMDTYSGPGTWNNSWTVWYGHAWRVINEILGDDESYENLMSVADFLLEQDEVDNDGGIPATENQYYNDQSWTSAYIIWYNLEYLLDQDSLDVIVEDVIYPTNQYPVARDHPYNIQVCVSNGGMFPLDDVLVEAIIGEFSSNATITLGTAQTDTVLLAPAWIPETAGETIATIVASHPGDNDPTNDTLSVTFDIAPSGHISGIVYDERDDSPIQALLQLYYLDHEDEPILYEMTTGVIGDFDVFAAEGLYRLEVHPERPPFTSHIYDSLEIVADENYDLDLALHPAQVLVVSEVPHETYDPYYMNSLELLGVDTYLWRTAEMGFPDTILYEAEAVIWVTGDHDGAILNPRNWNFFNIYLSHQGRILLTGQNIFDRLGDISLLRTRFGVTHGELDIYATHVRGDFESPLFSNDSLLLLGSGGAGNQNDIDEIIPFEDGVPILNYNSTGAVAAVMCENTDEMCKTVFCGFGVEGINSEQEPAFLRRSEFLRRVLVWFDVLDDSTGISDDFNPTLPDEFSVSTWPNPFNPSMNFVVSLPDASELSVTLYDVLGREVEQWNPGRLQAGSYTFSWDGSGMASGVYFLKTRTITGSALNKVILLR